METQNIIITGGASRIGAEIAKSLANPKTQITIQYNRSKIKAQNLSVLLIIHGHLISPINLQEK